MGTNWVERWKDFKKLRAEGFTLEEIGEKYGITKQAVSIRLVKGRPKPENPPNPLWVRVGNRKGRDRTRALVRERDKYTCQNCGKIRTPETVREHNKGLPTLKGRIKLFDVHHLKGQCGENSLGYDSTKNLKGLITLCHKCHYNRHDHRAYGKYRK